MNGTKVALVALLTLAGCGRSDKNQAIQPDTANRDLQLAPVDTTSKLGDKPLPDTSAAKVAVAPADTAKPAPVDTPKATPPKVVVAPPVHPAQKPVTLKPVDTTATKKPMAAPTPAQPSFYTAASGTRIEATASDTLSTRHIKPPYAFSAPVASDVVDALGHVVIPAGSMLRIRLTDFAPAPNKSAKDGKLAAILLKVTINGVDYRPNATIDSIDHILKGRGVGGAEVAKAGGGAAAGAVIGGLIGKGKGAVIGGVLGAAGGTAVAVETADRDVVIPPGAKIHLSLRDSLQVPAK
jgi:hypothetical protein